jgi:outer membrane immunogenic protein
MGAQMMKRLARGIAGLAALVAAPAMAADMPVKYVAPPPIFSWTGCYIGVHVGAGWQVSDFAGGNVAASGVGAVGGAQAGCNLQWRQFVIGLEGEFWGSSLYDRDYFQNQFETDDRIARNRWDGTFAVRSGLAFDRAFVYGKVGVAVGKFDYTADFAGFGQTSTIRGSATIAGVLIGVGFEYALTDNWTTKFEYNYIDFGNKIVNFTDTDCNILGCVTTAFSQTVKERKQLAKIGLNYKFSYDPPVIAKY